jgi:hypothetical protein
LGSRCRDYLDAFVIPVVDPDSIALLHSANDDTAIDGVPMNEILDHDLVGRECELGPDNVQDRYRRRGETTQNASQLSRERHMR